MFFKQILCTIKHEIQKISLKTAGIGAVIAVFLGMSGFIFSADPYFLTGHANMPKGTPPLLLMILLQMILYAGIGAIISCLICCRERHLCRTSYSAALYLAMALIFCYTWYPLFFAARTPFLSLIALIAAGILCFLSFTLCSRLHVFFAILHLLYMVYLLFILYLNFAFLLIN